MKLRQITDIELTNKKVFLRLDLNVPLKNGKITDDTRIQAAIPTIKHLLAATPYVVLASHLGRPDGEYDAKYSLDPVGQRLAELLGREIALVRDYTESPIAKMLSQFDRGQVVLLENLRFHPGETECASDFSRILADGFDAYVNDAFGTVHRAHASITGVPELLPLERRAAGFLVMKEVEALNRVLLAPQVPFTVVMGGAKVSDKVAVILNLMNLCNNLVIGGAMAYTFLKYRGMTTGTSKTEDDKFETIASIYRTAEARKVTITLPVDHVCADSFSETAKPVAVASASIPPGLMGLDIGPRTQDLFRKIIRDSKTVFWNGPMGVFEWPAFAAGSLAVAKAMASIHQATTLVGGGDSVAAVNVAGVAERMSHISTGGGASLEYLEGQSLPGLKVLSA